MQLIWTSAEYQAMAIELTARLLSAAERIGLVLGESKPTAALVDHLGDMRDVGRFEALRRFSEGLAVDQETVERELEALADRLRPFPSFLFEHYHVITADDSLRPTSRPWALARGVTIAGAISGSGQRSSRRVSSDSNLVESVRANGLVTPFGEDEARTLAPAARWPHPPERGTFALLEIKTDEAIQRVGGPGGATLAADTLREILGTLPLIEGIGIFDFGNILPRSADSPTNEVLLSQIATAEAVYWLQEAGLFTLLLGGGRDVAYGHWLGLSRANPHERLGVVTFGKEPGLEPIARNAVTVFHPFWQIGRRARLEGKSPPLLAVGVDREALDPSTAEAVGQLGAQIVYGDALDQGGVALSGFLDGVDRLYLNLDMGVFRDRPAAGVEGPNPRGIQSGTDFSELFDRILDSGKLVGADVTGFFPNRDDPARTTGRLGADLIHRLLARSRGRPTRR